MYTYIDIYAVYSAVVMYTGTGLVYDEN